MSGNENYPNYPQNQQNRVNFSEQRQQSPYPQTQRNEQLNQFQGNNNVPIIIEEGQGNFGVSNRNQTNNNQMNRNESMNVRTVTSRTVTQSKRKESAINRNELANLKVDAFRSLADQNLDLKSAKVI